MRYESLVKGFLPVTLFSTLAAAIPAYPTNLTSGPGCIAVPPGSGPSSTCNTADNRACWSTGFHIGTDWYSKTPFTGATRKVCLTCFSTTTLDHALTSSCIVPIRDHGA